MDLVDSFQLQISLSTADVPGISQLPSGTSLNSASSTLNWGQIRTFSAIIILQESVLQSQMLLQIMGINRSCCAVSLVLIQCTRWGIPFKSYSRLLAISIQDLMQLTRL